MTRLRDSTRHAEDKAWPAVKAALAEQTTPIVIDKLVRTKQSRSNVRFVVEQTIQAIAAAGLLRTPVDADVIGKAVAWHESWDEEDLEPMLQGGTLEGDTEERELYEAVAAMLNEIEGWPAA